MIGSGRTDFVELHACGDTGKVSAFVNGSERIGEVLHIKRVRFRAGSVAEANVRIFLRGLNHIIFVPEGIGKDCLAALRSKIFRRIVASFVFFDAGYKKYLFFRKTFVFSRFVHRVDEVLIVRGRGIVKRDKTDFEVRFVYLFEGGFFLAASRKRGGNAACHHSRKSQRYKFLHRFFLLCPDVFSPQAKKFNTFLFSERNSAFVHTFDDCKGFHFIALRAQLVAAALKTLFNLRAAPHNLGARLIRYID